MKALANQIQAYLALLNPSIGPIYKLKTPDAPDIVNVILFSGGDSPDGEFGFSGMPWLTPGLILRTRGAKDQEQEPLDRMMRIFDHVLKIQALNITDAATGKTYRWEIVRPDQMPFIFERDALARTVWTSNWSMRAHV